MDQASWHKSYSLRKYGEITIKYLPPYSPELNPVEKLWWWLRKEVVHNRIFKTITEIMDALEKEFKKLSPSKILSLCSCNYL